ncbi:unnamed protein product [Caenorhabditis bovis]|uniref:Uncharacterized protein n=1 Tax=Caenorhabditis bovis TaxID=2654633 RepID=A0A8S1ELP2_9PELO|nr:unnamed protein product [Caenorhabditis bovis]
MDDQKSIDEEQKENDTGYYTPKNILNPAMFRLSEITKALHEVNNEIEKDNAERMYILNNVEHDHFHDDIAPQPLSPIPQPIKESSNFDDLDKILFFLLLLFIGIFLLILVLSWS